MTTTSGKFLTLTTAQAIVKYLQNQWIEIDGERVRLCGGGFGIFGPRQRNLPRRSTL